MNAWWEKSRAVSNFVFSNFCQYILKLLILIWILIIFIILIFDRYFYNYIEKWLEFSKRISYYALNGRKNWKYLSLSSILVKNFHTQINWNSKFFLRRNVGYCYCVWTLFFLSSYFLWMFIFYFLIVDDRGSALSLFLCIVDCSLLFHMTSKCNNH